MDVHDAGLLVEVEVGDDGSYVVSDPTVLISGSGASLLAALDDYVASLLSYIDLVAARAYHGSGYDRRELLRVFDYLRATLAEE